MSSREHRPGSLVPVACLLCGLAAWPALAGIGYDDSPSFSLNTTAVSATDDYGLPTAHRLGTCVPNPFNPLTRIEYELARAGMVDLAVYDLKGRLVRRLEAGRVVEAGRHWAQWDGRDASGRSVAAGVYFYRMRCDSYTATRRMTLLK